MGFSFLRIYAVLAKEFTQLTRDRVTYAMILVLPIVQLMLFGMLLMDMNDAATIHGVAARRAGASWEEIQAGISLSFLFRGLPAATRGADILAELARRENEAGGAQA